jgi:hypothetical protein
MRTRRSFTFILLTALVVGCGESSKQVQLSQQVSTNDRVSTNEQISTSALVSQSEQIWPDKLTEEEELRCKDVAWRAAGSRAMWNRFKPERITSEPLKLSKDGIRCYLERNRFDTVDVAIPSGGSFGWHPTYIAVTVARGTYELLDMHEGFWP